MTFDITASIVLYKNERELLSKTIQSYLDSKLRLKLYLIDNSPTDELKDIINDPRVEYIYNNNNVGFGAGHNVAIRKSIPESSFHLVLNPDIYFDDHILGNILEYMRKDEAIGVLMPKILNADGSIQYVAKLLPTPFDFFVRRFLPFGPFRKISERFELRHTNYDQVMMAPFLSGCFMVFRTEALGQVGLFDEKIFMYTEDIDITRRVLTRYKAIFYPKAFVYHDHTRKSFRNFKTLGVYLKSAIYYFNKWGWFFDSSRREINKRTLSQFNG